MTTQPVARIAQEIPYTCQFASPDLVAAFLQEGRPLDTDPNWAAYGADSPAAYAFWASRACGVVCVKMVVEGLGGRMQSVMAWVEAGLAADGYLTEQRAERPVEKGWKHEALAEMVRREGLEAELVSGLEVPDVTGLIRAGRCLMASVSSELGEGQDTPITRQNGHVVVVYGYERYDDGLTSLLLHNPSGRTAGLRAGARVPAARFAQAFSGRGIAIGPSN